MSFIYYATYSGKKFDVSKVTEKDLCLDDISHHLTKICRYGGAMELGQHYSVAQHSVLLCEYALLKYENVRLARYMLMHDASEAYLGDVVSGLKQHLPDYKELEKKVQSLIEEKYNIATDKKILKLGKELDTRILLDEAYKFAPQHYELFVDNCPKNISPLGLNIQNNNDLKLIKELYLEWCNTLCIRD